MTKGTRHIAENLPAQISPLESSKSSNLDLRAPVLASVRKGLGLALFRTPFLIAIDCILISLAWWVAEVYGTPLASVWKIGQNPQFLFLILILAVGLLSSRGLYNAGSKRRDYFRITQSLTLSHVFLLLIAFFYQPGYFVSRSTFILSWCLSVLLVCLGRFVADGAVEYLREKGAVLYPAYLLGHPKDVSAAAALLEREGRYRILGTADILSLEKGDGEETISNIISLGVAEVFICSSYPIENPMFLYWRLRNAGITLYVLPIGLEPLLLQKPDFLMVGGLPATRFSPPFISGTDFLVKRGFDFLTAAIALLLTAPLYLVIALLIRLDSPGPIFYRQTRVGLRGQQFKVWKFRTMVTNADQLQKDLESQNEMQDGIMFKMKDDPRITKIGKFLRRYSFDELPQLFNILFGEMSLIGPRPFPLRDVEKFDDHHFIRHEVLPGITGLWQVSGRSEITDFEEVVRLDTTYIENWSLWLDFQILLRTVKVVFQRRGAY
jgi:exopolysaccharide biosynthesis polyprenyl glycosylphosphotransferase